jgi:hypothetical protein
MVDLYAPHCDDCVQITANAFGVSGVEIGFCGLQASVLNQGLHRGVDLIEFVEGINVGHVTGIQNVVQILQKGFTFNLGVTGEREDKKLEVLGVGNWIATGISADLLSFKRILSPIESMQNFGSNRPTLSE